jgi:hypothetical protein
MSSYLDDILCFISLIATNAAIALILYGFAPEITAWAIR